MPSVNLGAAAGARRGYCAKGGPTVILHPEPRAMSPEIVTAYLARLNVSSPLSKDLATLRLLQERHMLSVPFENFHVFLGRGASTNLDQLADKVIHRRRGGYCFELNTLYGELLRTLGFTVKPVLARVLLRSPDELPPRNHLVNLIDLAGSWYLTDVGFGGLASRIPLPIAATGEIHDGDGSLRLVPKPDGEYLLERQTTTGWQPQYQFQTIAAAPADIEVVNFYTYQHPDSLFVNHRLIGLFTPTGRIGLFDRQFTERKGVVVVDERELVDEAEWREVVWRKFGVEYG